LVAESPAAFELALANPPRAEDLLLLPVVHAFELAKGKLAPGCCLGFTTLPVFGGAYTAENRYAIRIVEYASLTGDLHRQIRDLPGGTEVHRRVVP